MLLGIIGQPIQQHQELAHGIAVSDHLVERIHRVRAVSTPYEVIGGYTVVLGDLA